MARAAGAASARPRAGARGRVGRPQAAPRGKAAGDRDRVDEGEARAKAPLAVPPSGRAGFARASVGTRPSPLPSPSWPGRSPSVVVLWIVLLILGIGWVRQ